MTPAELIEKWKGLLDLQAWKIRLRDEEPPSPSVTSALSDTDCSIKEAVVWVKNERGAIHELCHVLLAGLDDVFWRAERTKALDTLWSRREEEIVKRLERAFVQVMRNPK